MKLRLTRALLALFGLPMAWQGVATAASPSAASEAYPAARRTSTYVYDESGRAVESEVVGYDAGGVLQHRTRVRMAYDARGRVTSEESTTSAPDGTQMGTALVTYEYDAAGDLVAEDRLWIDAAGKQVRRESDAWRTEADGTRVKETVVHDASDLLVETRYAIATRDARGRVLSSDESRYDRGGAQLGRHLVELTHGEYGFAARVLHSFDSSDDMASKVVESWTYDDHGRLRQIDARFFNAAGHEVERSTDVRMYSGTTGRMTTRTYAFSTPDGHVKRRLQETFAYDAAGHLLSQDGAWTYATR